MSPFRYARLQGGLVVPVLQPATTGANGDDASDTEMDKEKPTQKQVMSIVVCVLTHLRDGCMLLLGGSLLHVASNVLTTEEHERVEKCVFFEPTVVLILAVLWVATLVAAVLRYMRLLSLVPDTILDLALVFLGSALQIAVKPSDWISSVQDRWCSITDSNIGAIPLLVWLLGETLSFVSAAKTVVDYATRPPCGTPGVLWVVIYLVLGILSFPLIDMLIAPAMRELVDQSLNGTLVV